MIKLVVNFFHIGDQVCTTGIPENIFASTGKKSIITNPNIWVFAHNPYVEFKTEEEAAGMQTVSILPDCRDHAQAQKYFEVMQSTSFSSQTEYMCRSIGLTDVRLRHPRLYIYEDEETQPDKIVVHTSGSDRTRDGEPAIRTHLGEDSERNLSDEAIAAILDNYKHYQIIQVGGINDKPLGGHSVDCRGKYNYWQTAKEIASAAKFIGVNSGPMHIANCYPRVEKRIVLTEFPATTLLQYSPGDLRNLLFSWMDPANTYFNKFDRDVGVTFSFEKI